MKNYNVFNSDDLDRRGFIDRNVILDYVSQEEIFQLVFGYLPEEYVYVVSPFRRDKNPGCWFERTSSYSGKLRFVDFANDFNKPMDCFDAVQKYFQISNFYLTLEFIYERLIKGKNRVAERRIAPSIIPDKERVSILFDSRKFQNRDADYWKKYEISKQNLISDKVFAVNKYYLTNTKVGNVTSRCYDICYAYTEFEEGRKKLYFPYREGKKRFITNCNKDDIGGLYSLPPFGNQLIITKSYKDWRVLVNNGKYAIWFQNEGMRPSESKLMNIVKKFNKVIVFFDNDEQGIKSSQIISENINSHFPSKSSPLWLPESLNERGISDPSDLIYKEGRPVLQQFLYKFT